MHKIVKNAVTIYFRTYLNAFMFRKKYLHTKVEGKHKPALDPFISFVSFSTQTGQTICK